MGGVGLLVVVEDDPAPDPGLGFRSSFPSVQIDAFMLQGPPEAFDEDAVDAPAHAIYRKPGADPFHSVRPRDGRELAALIGGHDLGQAELVDRSEHHSNDIIVCLSKRIACFCHCRSSICGCSCGRRWPFRPPGVFLS